MTTSTCSNALKLQKKIIWKTAEINKEKKLKQSDGPTDEHYNY